jgi:hypothetical protein
MVRLLSRLFEAVKGDIMPGYDGTGPRGYGSMTGRGMGYCAVPGTRRWFGGGAFGWGRSLGRGRGLGFGRGAYGVGPSYGAPGFGYAPPSAQDELSFLQDQADAMESELKQMRSRMDELRQSD